jgi:hypothetical protein
MSSNHEDIDKYILKRFEFIQKLGKGVRCISFHYVASEKMMWW